MTPNLVSGVQNHPKANVAVSNFFGAAASIGGMSRVAFFGSAVAAWLTGLPSSAIKQVEATERMQTIENPSR
jgi:hypothetical protein